MGSEWLNLTQYAQYLGVSRQRVGRLKSEGRLNGCYVMHGRTCMIDVAKADKKLRGSLDPSQNIKARPQNHNDDLTPENRNFCDNFCKLWIESLYGIYTLSEFCLDPLKASIQKPLRELEAIFKE